MQTDELLTTESTESENYIKITLWNSFEITYKNS